MAIKKEKTGRKEGKLTPNGDPVSSPAADRNSDEQARRGTALAAIVIQLRTTETQQKTGMALIAGSLLAIAASGAWFGPDPASGAMQWLGWGLVQSTYAALLALSVWIVFGRRRGVTYLLWLGFACSTVAIWDIAGGIYSNRLRLEANDTLVTFRDDPLNIVGLTGIIERNPYVEAYMVMRDAHWDLQDRLDKRIDGYDETYGEYVKGGEFLSVERLYSRYELWRAFYQVDDLVKLLDEIEKTPFETTDLLWTVELLDVDAETGAAYAKDLEQAVAEADAWQSEFIAREIRTLQRIRQSLKVVIDARGRYRFAEGRIVFDDPADAARFTGKEPPAD